MRFIVKEQPYEKKIASGLFQYEQDEKLTGAVESWRLTTAVPGYQILRVDLDAREAASGNSTLFHLVQTDDGVFERLTYRFWNDKLNVEGNVLFEENRIIERRTVNKERRQQDLAHPPHAHFWFPSTVGLGLLANLGMQTELSAFTLNMDPANLALFLGLKSVTLALTTGPVEPHLIHDKEVIVRPLTVEWENQKRVLWLDDETNWPLKMVRDDGLTAVESQGIWY